MSFFSKIKTFVRGILHHVHDAIENAAIPAMKIIDIIGEIIKNPALNVVAAFTKGDVDDKILRYAQQYVPRLAEAWGIISSSEGKTLEQVVASVADFIKNLPAEVRARILRELAAHLTEFLSDGKLTLEESIVAIQMAFTEKYQGTDERAAMLDAVRAVANTPGERDLQQSQQTRADLTQATQDKTNFDQVGASVDQNAQVFNDAQNSQNRQVDEQGQLSGQKSIEDIEREQREGRAGNAGDANTQVLL